MTIEGLGKKFQEARRARNLTLDEAARITKIRPQRLAEIEADDFSQFPSLAYAKGFLQIYGKFLDVDVTPYLDAFEDSERVTVDGYSYLQENSQPRLRSAPVVRRRAPAAGRDRISPMPLLFGIVILVIGFSAMKLLLNVKRLAPTAPVSAAPADTAAPLAASVQPQLSPNSAVAAAPSTEPSAAPAETPAPLETRKAIAVTSSSAEPEVRRAKPVTREDLEKAQEQRATSSPAPEAGEQNRIAIRPLKRTYVRVTLDNDNGKPAFERWVSPADGPVEFRGKHVSIRVLDPDAVKITKNGQALEEGDEDVTVN